MVEKANETLENLIDEKAGVILKMEAQGLVEPGWTCDWLSQMQARIERLKERVRTELVIYEARVYRDYTVVAVMTGPWHVMLEKLVKSLSDRDRDFRKEMSISIKRSSVTHVDDASDE